MWVVMTGGKLLSPCLAWVVVIVVLINLLPISSAKVGGGGGLCNASSCGHILNISYPFRLKSDPPACGDTKYELVCENNTRAVMSLNSDKYYVKAINYNNFTIRVAYAGAGVDHNYCSSLPRTSLTTSSFGSKGPYSLSKRDWYSYMDLDQSIKPINFLSCRSPVDSPLYLDSAPCTVNKSSYTSTGQYSYFAVGLLNASMVREQCSVELVVMTSSPRLLRLDNEAANLSFTDVQSGIAYGFELFWFKIQCANCLPWRCYLNATNYVRCDGYLDNSASNWKDAIEMAEGREGTFSKLGAAVSSDGECIVEARGMLPEEGNCSTSIVNSARKGTVTKSESLFL